MASGIAWAVLMRWAIRFIGLFSALILARLLSPDDFGVAAMGMLVMNFLFELSQFGMAMNLIRRKEIDREHCDTAWTMAVIQGISTSVLLVICAYPVSLYFSEPRVIPVMYFLAVASLLEGLESIGPILLRRELRFSADFRFNVWKKVVSFVATITAALILRNYWALVIGIVADKIAGVVISYLVHPYRPRFSLTHYKEYLNFGASIIPLRAANTMLGMIGQFMVGGTSNASTLGSYRLAGEISRMFTSEIVIPMGRGLLPNYARLADRPDELSAMYRKVLAGIAFFCIPIGVGVSAVAPDLTLVLLGPQWASAASLMQYLAIGAAVFAITQAMVNQILVATGREKSAAVLAWVRLLITAPVLWVGLQYGGIIGLAQATIVAPLIYLPLIYMETRRAVALPVFALVEILWRPLIASVVMYAAVLALPTGMLDYALVRLIADALFGVIVFTAVVFLLWRFSGSPDGAEQITLSAIRQVVDKVLKKRQA